MSARIEVTEEPLAQAARALLEKCGQPTDKFTCVDVCLTGFSVKISFACTKGGAEALDLNPLHLVGCLMVIDSLDPSTGELGLTMAMGEVKAVKSVRKDLS